MTRDDWARQHSRPLKVHAPDVLLGEQQLQIESVVVLVEQLVSTQCAQGSWRQTYELDLLDLFSQLLVLGLVLDVLRARGDADDMRLRLLAGGGRREGYLVVHVLAVWKREWDR